MSNETATAAAPRPATRTDAPSQALSIPASAPVMNPTIEAQLAHRTIRAYSDEPLGEDVVTTLLEVARHSASSSFQQQTTVIRVKDQAVRDAVHASSGQPYVGGSKGELFVFVVDLHRNAVIRERAGADLEPLERTTLFIQGVEDTLIAAQNVVVAAESLGLGTTFLGSIVNEPRLVIEALRLPERTFPLVGLLVGHAAQSPQYKPRLPLELMSGVDSYPEPAEHEEALAAYDAVVEQYYDLRDTNRRVDSFTTQIARALGAGKTSRVDLLAALHEQRLCLH